MFKRASSRWNSSVVMAPTDTIERIACPGGVTATYIEPTTLRFDQTIIGLHAWTASGVPDFQRQRWGAVAETLGTVTVLPDTPGQGLESPCLTDVQIEQMKRGDGTALGEMMAESIMHACQQKDRTLGRVALVGSSQAGSLMPSLIDALPESVVVEKAVLYNAVGPRGFGLIPGMILGGSGGLKKYRRAEGTPKELQTAKDTDIVATIKRHPRNILLRYPLFMARQDFTGQLAQSILSRNQATEVVFVQGESDTASRKRATKKAVEYLKQRGITASYMGMAGHKHQMMEDTPAFISELREILRGY